ncbi:ecdysteroid-phosphate phosphatase isoform X2 [Chironomus tepperi]|uniref:ecdysteroid-phosphate phosphatase isoform X2 n=1 Tax=Chironomus tepperi TaxID=113505 RepID=UPI00391FAE1D
MASLPLPPRKQSRNFTFSQTSNKIHKHTRIREYILYCCPTNHFQKGLENFWSQAKELFNGSAHNYSIPHITLVSFFKAHEDVNFLDTLKTLAEDGKYLNRPMELELYTSSNFIGFFVKEDDANVLKRIALKFVKEIQDSTISLEPHVKNLHLTLAYQFPSNVYQNLADLVEQIDTSYANSWELRLYSRDPRLATKQVHKVIYSHSSREHDELELRVGDYVYINGDAIQNSIDGWVEGISCNGNVGFLPLNHTERTSETNVWTLNATVPLCQASDNKEISTDAIDGVVQSHILREDFYINENRFSQTSKMDESVTSNLTRRGRRRILILRHGERVDFAFGNTWTQFSFNDSQNYVRMDLNMPETLPPRVTEDWEKDSPLTTIGSFQCHQVGQSLKNFGVNFSKVYVSPSYRCVQTANEVLSAMDAYDVPLNVEYGLFEWCLWYELGLPQFLTEKELAVIFNINEEYIPFMKKDDLEEILKESLEDFYSRSLSTMRKILSNSEDGDILIVAHAISIETLSRELVGKEQRSRAELRNLLMRIPYLATVAITETDDHSYQFIEPPCLTLTHNSCSKFDWRILDDN